jgi:peroxiredoxin
MQSIEHIKWLYSVLQRPQKQFESGVALARRGTFVYDQDQTILFSQAGRKFSKIWNIYNVGLMA